MPHLFRLDPAHFAGARADIGTGPSRFPSPFRNGKLDITTRIVSEGRITTMMITHDMQAALTLGNRTIMMDDGKIIFDISGEERAKMTVEDLLECYHENSRKKLTNDRMLLK